MMFGPLLDEVFNCALTIHTTELIVCNVSHIYHRAILPPRIPPFNQRNIIYGRFKPQYQSIINLIYTTASPPEF